MQAEGRHAVGYGLSSVKEALDAHLEGEVIGRLNPQESTFGTRTVHEFPSCPVTWDGKRDVNVRSLYWGYVAHAGWVKGLVTVTLTTPRATCRSMRT